jgi:hypothetical protein
MAVVGLTEQLMLRRVREDTPHYVRCREQLETFVEAMAANDQEQGLWNEEFESDEEDDDVLGPGKRKRAAQGRIQYALLLPSFIWGFAAHSTLSRSQCSTGHVSTTVDGVCKSPGFYSL